MIVDLLIVLFGISALYRGRSIGFARQLCSTLGFFVGLLFGAWLGPHVITHVHGVEARALTTVSVTLGSALIFLTIGEVLGYHLKRHLQAKRINTLDMGLGSVLSVISLLLSVWLVASLINSTTFPSLQSAVRSSRIIGALNRILPSAPNAVTKLGRLINPNGFPDVFVDNEPVPDSDVNLPSLGELAGAVQADQASVVRIEGRGCGGVVTGSGFVARSGLVATNAHVVAGIRRPYVQDANGSHPASVIWFDPDLDFAVLRTSNLAGKSLSIDTSTAGRGTPGAVLGYPGGGAFNAKSAVVLDEIRASGRDIYGTGHTLRDVYELRADVIPGNSGGPIVNEKGAVIGVVFAESTNYNHVGYALTTAPINNAINQAAASNQAVSTGRCAE